MSLHDSIFILIIKLKTITDMITNYFTTDSPMYASIEREDIGGDFGDAIWGDI